MTEQVIEYAMQHSKVAATMKHDSLLEEITKLVENRRKNLQNNKNPKKDGSLKNKLDLIYEKQKGRLVVLKDGQMYTLTKPKPLPLQWAPPSTKPVSIQPASPPATPRVQNSAGSTSVPAVPQIVPAATNSVVDRVSVSKLKPSTAATPKKQQQQKKQESTVSETETMWDDDDSDDFDLFTTMDKVNAKILKLQSLQEKLQALELKRAATAKQKAVAEGLGNAQWVNRAITTTNTLGVHVGGATTTTCV